MERKKITFFTGHYWETKRKAGFHWLADAFLQLGFDVLFFTAPISYLLKLKGDYRFQFPLQKEKGRLIEKKQGLYSYVHFTPWHVANLRSTVLNRLSKPLFKNYDAFPISKEAEAFIAQSQMITFESTPGLFLFDRVNGINHTAKYIYRVSDDLRLLNVHPLLLEMEKQVYNKFDLVSVPSSYIYDVLKAYGKEKLKLQFHGLNKNIFDSSTSNPYLPNSFNLVFVGNSHFDHNFLQIASDLRPNWQFHIIGPLKELPGNKNIIAYGEMPFEQTVPYIKFANVGLQARSYSPGAESLSDSLKMQQYTFCGLPIIAPAFLESNKRNVFYYEIGNRSSIEKALDQASEFTDQDLNEEIAAINTWVELSESWID